MRIKDVDRRENYTMVEIGPSIDENGSTGSNANALLNELYDADRWCYETKCGKRVTRWKFAFKTEEEFTWFKLRWIK